MRTITMVAALLAASAGVAHAELTIAAGTKWLPLNYTTPVSTTGGAAGGTPTPTPLKGFNTTSINNYGGVFILDGKLGLLLGLDFGYSSQSTQTGMSTTDLSYTQFGFSLAAKYYLMKPTRERVVPYAYFDFYKYFASVSVSLPAGSVPKGSEDFLGGLASPLGINLAGGAEYFFTPNFSLGAEIFGLRYAYAAGSTPMGSGFGAPPGTTQTTHNVSFYTGVSLNFRFAVGEKPRVTRTTPVGEGPTTEDDAETTPTPAHKKGPRTLPREEKPEQQAPPTEPPPKEAEPVD
jgi:hypothetical protein